MSYVTDIVFVCRGRKITERFQELVRTLYTRMDDPYTPEPVKDSGPNASGTTVFHLGLDYADGELLEALRAEMWPLDTMLWIESEIDEGPEIRIGSKLTVAGGGFW